MMYSNVGTPSREEDIKRADLHARMRRFDHNRGRSFDLPTTDPKGTPLADLTIDELRSRMGWCMEEMFHQALYREIQRRAECSKCPG